MDDKEKGKERVPMHPTVGGTEEPSSDTRWQVLASWNVDMDELVPLPVEVRPLLFAHDNLPECFIVSIRAIVSAF